MSFAKLKKQRKGAIEKLTAAGAEQNKGNNFSDDRFWQPTVDKVGNGYAVIRFLPSPVEDDLPWVQYWSHGFQGPGGWYIENSLTSIGGDDPVAQENSRLWNTGLDSDKEIARKRKRRLHYTSNILVVTDPGNPENEGKVFLFKYGKKIFDKIQDAMQPKFQDETPVNPFDMWDGANFKVKISKVEGFRNYDKSEFDSPSPVAKSDDDIEEVFNKLIDISEFIDPKSKHYKTYEELQKKMLRVLGDQYTGPGSASKPIASEPAPEPKAATPKEPETASSPDEDGDGELSYFEKLAKNEED